MLLLSNQAPLIFPYIKGSLGVISLINDRKRFGDYFPKQNNASLNSSLPQNVHLFTNCLKKESSSYKSYTKQHNYVDNQMNLLAILLA